MPRAPRARSPVGEKFERRHRDQVGARRKAETYRGRDAHAQAGVEPGSAINDHTIEFLGREVSAPKQIPNTGE